MYKLIELQQAMCEKGLTPDALYITSGHRTPKRNRSVGVASGSRHQSGDSLDLGVGDLDRNGSGEMRDKETVLRILEEKIISSRGGLGLYPGTQTVHMDLRGHRARWDTH